MSSFVKHVAEIESTDEAQQAFLDWLFDFEAVDDAAALLGMLIDCQSELPSEYCSQLGLANGSTFADAASVLGGPWGIV